MAQLQTILDAMAIFQQTYPEDACVLVVDTEKVVGNLPGHEIDIHINVGTPIQQLQDTVTHKTLTSGKKKQEERGAELFGVAYISTATPVIEDEKVVGVVSAIVSNKKLDTKIN